MSVTVEALDHLVMNVKDVETAAAWYERVLGMKRVVTEPRPGAKVHVDAFRAPEDQPAARDGDPEAVVHRPARSRRAATISAS